MILPYDRMRYCYKEDVIGIDPHNVVDTKNGESLEIIENNDPNSIHTAAACRAIIVPSSIVLSQNGVIRNHALCCNTYILSRPIIDSARTIISSPSVSLGGYLDNPPPVNTQWTTYFTLPLLQYEIPSNMAYFPSGSIANVVVYVRTIERTYILLSLYCPAFTLQTCPVDNRRWLWGTNFVFIPRSDGLFLEIQLRTAVSCSTGLCPNPPWWISNLYTTVPADLLQRINRDLGRFD